MTQSDRTDHATRIAEYRAELESLLDKIDAIIDKVAGDIAEFGVADTEPNEAVVLAAIRNADHYIGEAFGAVGFMEA